MLLKGWPQSLTKGQIYSGREGRRATPVILPTWWWYCGCIWPSHGSPRLGLHFRKHSTATSWIHCAEPFFFHMNTFNAGLCLISISYGYFLQLFFLSLQPLTSAGQIHRNRPGFIWKRSQVSLKCWLRGELIAKAKSKYLKYNSLYILLIFEHFAKQRREMSL